MGLLGLLPVPRRRSFVAPKCRALMVGLDNAGKSAILAKAHDDSAPESRAKIESALFGAIKITALSGAHQDRQYWKDYVGEADAIIFVVDSTDYRRFEASALALEMIRSEAPELPILVFANKRDSVTARSAQELAEALRLAEIRDRRWHFQECSAKTGEGIEEGLSWLASPAGQTSST